MLEQLWSSTWSYSGNFISFQHSDVPASPKWGLQMQSRKPDALSQYNFLSAEKKCRKKKINKTQHCKERMQRPQRSQLSGLVQRRMLRGEDAGAWTGLGPDCAFLGEATV